MKKIIILKFLLFLHFSMAQQPTLYLIGDSTMANKENPTKNPEVGWGQVLPQFFNSNIIIKNKAVNGRSTKSFLDEGRWNEILSELKEGDFVFIQFGHNDQKKEDPTRYTNPTTSYKNNLIKFITETKAKKATPILLSSIARRNFNDKRVLEDTHGLYPLVAEMVANDQNILFIDAYSISENIEMKFGPEDSKKLHLHFISLENSYYPDGKTDNTHLSNLGANLIAQGIVEDLKKHQTKLNSYLK